MKALLTGSRVYGTPTEESDIDMVVLVTDEELVRLAMLADEGDKGLKFGRLNLITVTTEKAFAVWEEGTKWLESKKPVTREQAVRLLTAMRQDAGLELDY
jgi:predicted nucleotidyltransferase